MGTSGAGPNSFVSNGHTETISGPFVAEYIFAAGPEFLGPHNKHGALIAHVLAGGAYGKFEQDLRGQPSSLVALLPRPGRSGGGHGGPPRPEPLASLGFPGDRRRPAHRLRHQLGRQKPPDRHQLRPYPLVSNTSSKANASRAQCPVSRIAREYESQPVGSGRVPTFFRAVLDGSFSRSRVPCPCSSPR